MIISCFMRPHASANHFPKTSILPTRGYYRHHHEDFYRYQLQRETLGHWHIFSNSITKIDSFLAPPISGRCISSLFPSVLDSALPSLAVLDSRKCSTVQSLHWRCGVFTGTRRSQATQHASLGLHLAVLFSGYCRYLSDYLFRPKSAGYVS